MTTNCGGPAVGVFTKLLFEPGASPHTFDANSERYELDASANPMENFQRHGRLIGSQGITGKIYKLKQRVRQGGYFVYGRIVMNPSPGALSTLLPYLVGSDAGGGVFTPGNCLNTFGALFDRDGYTHEFKDGIVSRWTLQGSGISFKETGTPDLLTLAIDCIFKDDAWNSTAWPVPEPALRTTRAFTPYIFQDCDGAFTIEGNDREVYGFQLQVINKIKPRWANSFTMSSLPYAGKIVKLGLRLPFDANNDDLYPPSTDGAQCIIRFDLDNVGDTTTYTSISLTNLKIPYETPYADDEFDVVFENDGESYGDYATDTPEIVVTNVVDLSSSPSPTPSHTISSTPSHTASRTPSATPSRTASATPSATASSTVSSTPSSTASATPSATASATPSATPSRTASGTPSGTPSRTESATASATVSSTVSATPSSTQSPSATESATASGTASATESATASATPSATVSATPSATTSATASSTPSTSPSNTQSASATASSTASSTPSATASATASSTASATESNTPSSTASGV